MGDDEAALVRMWREKRGEAEPEDLSGNLIVQLGVATEDLNRRWYEANTGQVITDVQRHVKHAALRWMAATLDGRVEGTGAVFEAKFMLPWSFSEEAAAEKYMAQLQYNMWVVAAKSAVLSVITRGRPDQRRDCRLPLGGIMARTPIHPGEHLAEELKELSISAAELARQIDVPVNRITGIINGQRAITADTALRLGHWFGTSPEFWLNLQKLYELRLAREEVGDRVERLPKLTERKRKKENGAPRLF